jgi:hypothetical protein
MFSFVCNFDRLCSGFTTELQGGPSMSVLIAVLAFPILLSLAATGLTYAFFGLALARERSNRFTLVWRARGAACLVGGVGTSCVSQLVMGLTYPLGPIVGARSGHPPAPGQPAVVCLHGLYHNAAAFLAIRPALVRGGLGQVYCPTYRSLGTDFETEAARLLVAVRQAVAPDAPLLFCGHSLDGLFIRRLIAEPDIGRRTLAAVTLGTPHRGSALAALALGRLGRSLRPGGPLFAALDRLPDPSGAALLALASPVDNMVLPLSGLDVGRPAWREETTPPVSHMAMLYHPAVIARTVDFLRSQARGDTPEPRQANRKRPLVPLP